VVVVQVNQTQTKMVGQVLVVIQIVVWLVVQETLLQQVHLKEMLVVLELIRDYTQVAVVVLAVLVKRVQVVEQLVLE
tara:strand:+ start:27 stop:257 length:231 start_codon:yes stop_codon:yes gene_type:complete